MEDLPYDIRHAESTLRMADPIMGRLIDVVGPFVNGYDPIGSPFETLCETIAYQQLSGKAAATIYGRFRALTDESRPLDPGDVLALPEEAIRSAGMSRAKTAAIRDLSQKTIDGVVPDRKHLLPLTNQEIIDRLTQVRGVGAWSVKMFLIRRLGRPDVLPHDDLGIRKGIQRTYALPELPKPLEVVETAEIWRPYRTLASWYLWRSLELDESIQLA